MTNDETISEILNYKKKFKDRLAILVHHYQNKDIVSVSDFLGDSYRLSTFANESSAKYIIVSGVKFMAETVKILSKEGQIILTPVNNATCNMADMVDYDYLLKVWKKLKSENINIVPITYINSYADVKALCGENGGSVCTSSNAKKIIEHYLSKGHSILFLPDYNLGKNIGNSLGLKKDEIARVNSDLTFDSDNLKNVKLFLWDGFCCVHIAFNLEDVENARKRYKDAKIIVHPESTEEVVDSADLYGSTEKIYNTIKESAAGSKWVVGTESCFVNRIKDELKDKYIYELKPSYCGDMKKNTINALYNSIKSIELFEENGSPLKYNVNIEPNFLENAKKSLDKMLNIVKL
jgi:quinolinate synthase